MKIWQRVPWATFYKLLDKDPVLRYSDCGAVLCEPGLGDPCPDPRQPYPGTGPTLARYQYEGLYLGEWADQRWEFDAIQVGRLILVLHNSRLYAGDKDITRPDCVSLNFWPLELRGLRELKRRARPLEHLWT